MSVLNSLMIRVSSRRTHHYDIMSSVRCYKICSHVAFAFVSTSILALIKFHVNGDVNANVENGCRPILFICVTRGTMFNFNVDRNANVNCKRTMINAGTNLLESDSDGGLDVLTDGGLRPVSDPCCIDLDLDSMSESPGNVTRSCELPAIRMKTLAVLVQFQGGRNKIETKFSRVTQSFPAAKLG